LNSRASRTTIYAAAGTFTAAAVTVTVIATGPALLSAPGTGAPGTGSFGTTDLALSAGRHIAAAAGQSGAAGQAAEVAARRAVARQKAASGSPQQIAVAMLPSFGWPSSEFSCLNSLWQQESGWNPYAANPSSGAYGIPQALPGSKMASAGSDWQTSAATQIRWGLGYIQATYGSPCGAWGHESSYGWY
jgi:hypothetical protein